MLSYPYSQGRLSDPLSRHAVKCQMPTDHESADPVTEPPAVSHHDDWEEHWSSFGTATLFNPAQNLRRRLIVRQLGRLGRIERLVDLGSGTGDLIKELSQRLDGVEMAGIEYSRTGVELSTRKTPEATFLQCDLLADVNVPTDLIGWGTHAVCSEVLEHLDDPVTFLRNSKVFLAPGAPIIVTVPSGPVSAYDDHIGHRRHFRPSDLVEILEAADYEVVNVGRYGFPFFNLYKLLIVLRGSRLVTDIGEQNGRVSRKTMLAMRVFNPLFRFSEIRLPVGWQLVGVARRR